MRAIAEVRNNYVDDKGLTYIDVWLTDDDDESGFTIATIDDVGVVNWKRSLDSVRHYDLSPIYDAINEIIKQKEKP